MLYEKSIKIVEERVEMLVEEMIRAKTDDELERLEQKVLLWCNIMKQLE